MRIVCISDTHCQRWYDLPPADLLIHAGDHTIHGSEFELEQQKNWLMELAPQYRCVVTIPGNHDGDMEKKFARYKAEWADAGIVLLNEESFVFDGVKIYGSPITPRFGYMAFNRERGAEIKKHWNAIPGDTQLLITHGPPYGILDAMKYVFHAPALWGDVFEQQRTEPIESVEHVGCQEMLRRLDCLPDLKLHVFGHIHPEYGDRHIRGVTFVNACMSGEHGRKRHSPIEVEINFATA
jgi:Icc-related predicted phosphoesterase